MTATLEPVTGRYLHLALEGRPHRLYFEEAGHGIPLVCLHTAGADGRQFRALLNDPEITADYRVIAFDMPWHGKSSPPEGWQREDYQLTTERYTGMILALCEALELERPVAMGCSIGGRIVLNLAWQHPERFRALIGLQSAAYVERYYDAGWLNHPNVHGGEACGALAYGLVSPLSPEAHKWETVWHYMQGGPGIFQGDLFFYQIEGDVRDKIKDIDTSKCPLYMLTGEYDYSASPADSEAAAALIPGAKLTIMKGLGHFPMSENPEGFREYLLPVLKEIRGGG
ncbi:MAG TPA: alpha/beta hydrolase [Alphaproteobacteria bacterium]|nr:alpha/beta hydrolase [Alphaproteobacteria bacterium]